MREGGREEEREKGRKGGKKGGKERGREGGREEGNWGRQCCGERGMRGLTTKNKEFSKVRGGRR